MQIVGASFVSLIAFLLVVNHLSSVSHCIVQRPSRQAHLRRGPISRAQCFVARFSFGPYGAGFLGNEFDPDPDAHDSTPRIGTRRHYTKAGAKKRFFDPEGGFVDYYKTLSLDKSCTHDDIKRKYRELNEALNSLPGVDPKLRADVDRAYKVLTDPATRKKYDAMCTKRGREDDEDEGDTEDDTDSGTSEFESESESDSDFDSDSEACSDTDTEDSDADDNPFSRMLQNHFFRSFGLKPGIDAPRTPRRRHYMLNVHTTVEVDMKTLLMGGKVSVPLRKKEKCNMCNLNDAANESYIERCPSCKGQGMIESVGPANAQVKRSQFGYMRTSKTCMKCEGNGYHRIKDCEKCENRGSFSRDSTVEVRPCDRAGRSAIQLEAGRGHQVRRDGTLGRIRPVRRRPVSAQQDADT